MKYLLIIALPLLIICTVYSGVVYSYDTVDFTIQVLLANNKPLANVSITVKSSRVSMNSWTNTTDENGIAYFHGVITSMGKIYVMIRYSIYGFICNISNVVVENNIVLKIPYKPLSFNAIVVDEYNQTVNASYNILYNNYVVFSGETSNGEINIEGGKKEPYVLEYLGSGSSNWNCKNIDYWLEINTGDRRYLTSLNINEKKYVIDTYPPKISEPIFYEKKIEGVTRFRWITMFFNTSDGLNTYKLGIKVTIKDVLSGEKLRKNIHLVFRHNILLVNISFTVDLEKVSEYLLINITVYDEANHVSSKIIYYRINKSNAPREIGEETGSPRNNTTRVLDNVFNNNTLHNNIVFNNTSNGSSFIIPSVKGSDLYTLNLFYLGGVFVSLMIIIIETKYYRGRRDNY